jgi:hypothetical protein
MAGQGSIVTPLFPIKRISQYGHRPRGRVHAALGTIELVLWLVALKASGPYYAWFMALFR